MNERLHSLSLAGGGFASLLYFFKIGLRESSCFERLGQQISCRDRVMDREVDADAADRGHRVSGIANEQQSWFISAVD